MFEIKLDKRRKHFPSRSENGTFERILEKSWALKQNPVPLDTKRVWGMSCPHLEQELESITHFTGQIMKKGGLWLRGLIEGKDL